MKLSLILEAIDRWSKPTDKAAKTTRALAKDTTKLDRATSQSSGSMKKWWHDAQRAERVGEHLGRSIRRVADHDFRRLTSSISAAGRALGRFGKGALMKGATVAGWGIGAAVAAVPAALTGFAVATIANAAKFEQFEAALEQTEGSALKAKAAMAWVANFAAETPYEIDEVTAAFVRARGIGIDPATGAFRSLGDAAGATGKSLMDAIEMMGDAQTGEFERLKEFNITSSSKGNDVTFSYIDKAGKTAAVKAKKNAVDIRKAILGIFDARYAGGMKRQSETLIGIWGNLKDQITRFELKVAGKGIFDRVKSSLSRALDWMNSAANQSKIDEWATRLSGLLTTIWDKSERFIHDTNWNLVAIGISDLTGKVITLVGWLARGLATLTQWRIQAERTRLDKVINNPSVGQILFTDRPKAIRDARKQIENLDRLQYGEPQLRAAPSGDWGQGGRMPGVGRWPVPSPKGPVTPPKARIDLHVTTDPGAGVGTRKIAATGLDVQVNTGRAMGAFA